MTMFITGGTSSIGRVFVRECSARGIPMRLMVRKSSNRSPLEIPQVTFVEGDVTDEESVRSAMRGCQSVTHMAANVGHNVSEAEWWHVNCDGTRHVLKAAQDLHIESMVQVSTLSVLGNTQPGETADETHQVDPGRYVNLYQKTKHAGDEIALEYAQKGLNVKIVYPGFGYGCSQATSHPSLQEQTLLRMAAGKPVAIMGNGKNLLCLSYYKDTAAGILLTHEKGKAGEGYILGGENLNFRQIWGVVAQVLGKKPPRTSIPLPLLKLIASASRLLTGKSAFPPDFFEMIALNWCYSSRKARELLGWEPHTFEDGLRETWAEYQPNEPHPPV
jgi:dihydroflavonol-4-reductase